MTVFSIAVIWLVVGLAVAVVFGTAIRRTNRLREDEEVPQRMGGELQYMRFGHRTRCQLSTTSATGNVTHAVASQPAKKHAAKRRVAA